MLEIIVTWMGESFESILVFFGSMVLSSIWVITAFALGSFVIGVLTWPFRRLPYGSIWRIKDDDGDYFFQFRVALWAIIIGFAILQMYGQVFRVSFPADIPSWD
jgi:hypothetical protein